ncbi:Co-chaperone protein p23-1 [Bienertia sinuspersici]
MSRHPSVKWAQRSDKLYITIELPDANDVKLNLEPEGKFFFSAVKDGNSYEVDIDLLDKVNVEESKYNIGLRHIVYVIQKAEKKWWSKLIKQEGKPPAFLKVDWDKWVDEDEEDADKQFDFDGMDFSKLNMGEDDDLDMDDLKDEEEAEKNEEAGKGESVATAEEDKAKEEPIEPVVKETTA